MSHDIVTVNGDIEVGLQGQETGLDTREAFGEVKTLCSERAESAK